MQSFKANIILLLCFFSRRVECDIKCNKFIFHSPVSHNVCHVTKHMEFVSHLWMFVLTLILMLVVDVDVDVNGDVDYEPVMLSAT